MITKNGVAQVLWILGLAVGVGWFGWARLGPAPLYESTRISPDVFERVNERGQLVGAGPDTVVVFSNYQCVYCALLFERIDSILADDKAALTIRVRHFAHPSVDSGSFLASIAAECGAEQGLFSEVSDWLFMHREQLNAFSPIEAAKAVGVADLARFDNCSRSSEVRSHVLEDLEAGIWLEVRGTPTLVTRHRKVVGTMTPEQLRHFATSRE